jgi:carboxyl-terminal processing protease
LAAGVALGCVLCLVGPALARNGDATYRKLRVFTQVLNHVEQSYVEPVTVESLVHGAVSGMLATLDPHTIFMPPEEYRKMKEDTAGEFGGLGMEIEERDGFIVVVAPIAGAPADRAGILAGDRLVGVDGQPLLGAHLQDAWKLLRGLAGTKVVVRVKRASWPEPKDVALVRERVRLESVEGRLLEAGVGYVQIKGFQEKTGKELRAMLLSLAGRAGPGGLAGLVLDLRNNPGGLLEEAAAVADEFLLEGDIVTTQGRAPAQGSRLKAHPKDTQPGYPVVVLVNEGTASASEIVAGALQDHGRALVMGLPTFGKGSVQTLIELEDGSGLKLTVARYFTPLGRCIQGQGITPDVRVEAGTLPGGEGDKASAPLRERDLKHHLSNPTSRPGSGDAGPVRAGPPPTTDAQVASALDYLRAWRVFSRAGVAAGGASP